MFLFRNWGYRGCVTTVLSATVRLIGQVDRLPLVAQASCDGRPILRWQIATANGFIHCCRSRCLRVRCAPNIQTARMCVSATLPSKQAWLGQGMRPLKRGIVPCLLMSCHITSDHATSCYITSCKPTVHLLHTLHCPSTGTLTLCVGVY